MDMYDSGTGRWSAAQLSQARDSLAATSVGTVALFAGGGFGSTLFAEYFCCVVGRDGAVIACVTCAFR